MNKPVNLEGATNWEPSPNNLEPFWMGFTPNRAFKKRPRMIARAKDMHYYDMSGRPILDGSAAPFIYLLQSAGVVTQGALRRFMRIKRTVEGGDGDKFARLEPYEGYRLTFGIEFKHPAFKTSAQTAVLEFTPANYVKEVARARTFGFMRDFEVLGVRAPDREIAEAAFFPRNALPEGVTRATLYAYASRGQLHP